MRFDELLDTVGRQPVFTSAFLLAGDRDPADVRRQLSRWTASGKLIQLKRGVYVPAETYRRSEPHLFLLANVLYPGSYVSLQSVLAWYGLIPEYAFVTTSVSVRRTHMLETPLGAFAYRHLGQRAMFGFHETVVAPGLGLPKGGAPVYGPADGQRALVALPEKALVDLLYLEPGSDDVSFLEELRLAEGGFDADRAVAFANRMGYPRVLRSVSRLFDLGVLKEREA